MTTTTKERPILFSGPMVRALLDGRKTQTRRIVKAMPKVAYPGMKRLRFARSPWSSSAFVGTPAEGMIPEGDYDAWMIEDFAGNDVGELPAEVLRCPYGQPGDRLYVREAFAVDSEVGEGTRGTIPPAVYYRATDEKDALADWPGVKWKPSIHMPRALSRITLEITDVRVERLQEISEEDARAEGCGVPAFVHAKSKAAYRIGLRHLWDGLNAKRGFGWDTNPWVWVVEFERVEVLR